MAAEETLRTAVERYCTSIAGDRLLVQAAGGNVSWKSESTIWIKASGTWLADAEKKDVFVPVDRQPLDIALARGDFDVSPKALEGYGLRPSIETLLHALMPHRFVVHLHPVDAMAHLIRCNCEVDLQAALGDAFAWALVDYFKPGADLAQAVHAQLLEKPDVQVVLLKNHGVILGAETLEEIDRLLQALNVRLSKQPRLSNISVTGIRGPTAVAVDDMAYRVCPDATMHCLVSDPNLYERLGDCWAICPDHVVFLGAKAMRVDDQACLRSALSMAYPAPPFVFVKGAHVLENCAVTQVQKAQLTFYLDVMLRQPTGQALATISQDQITSLLNWDAEKYRQLLNQ